MSSGGLLAEIVAFADSIRGNTAETFGPYADMVILACQSMAAAVALLLLGAGSRLWAPPAQTLPNLAPRAAALLSVVALLLIYLSDQDPQSTITPLRVAIWSTGALVVFGAAYVILYQILTFRCPKLKTLYLRGFFLTQEARRVLNNDGGTLPEIRTITGTVRPTDPQNYFCRADRERPELVWTKGSLDAAKLLLIAFYIPFAMAIIILLGSSALALQQAQTRIYEAPNATVARVPADLLFDFGSARLKPGASADLKEVAQLIREHWESGPVVIAGHTDSIGSDSANHKLSHDRATSVARWLEREGGLKTIPFDLQSHGEKNPIAPNTFVDGADNPEGRRLNRRVVVSIPRASGAHE